MKKLYVTLITVAALPQLALAAPKVSQAEKEAYQQKVKTELQVLTKDLVQDLRGAQASVTKLKREKIRIEENLVAMRDWGITQQNEKLEYYNASVKAQEALKKEEVAHQKTLERYHRVKMIMAALAGFCFLLIYFRFGSNVVSGVSTALGPWGIIATLAAPILSFALGFGIVFMLF
jgi:predicted anti-sigma-YlaC factor YlaD